MSDFTDFLGDAWDRTTNVLGTSSCTVSGHSYDGVVDQFTAVRHFDIGGVMGEYDGVAVLKLAEVAADAGATPEKYFEGKNLVVSGRTYKIERAAVDELTVTLGLVNPNRVKT